MKKLLLLLALAISGSVMGQTTLTRMNSIDYDFDYNVRFIPKCYTISGKAYLHSLEYRANSSNVVYVWDEQRWCHLCPRTSRQGWHHDVL